MDFLGLLSGEKNEAVTQEEKLFQEKLLLFLWKNKKYLGDLRLVNLQGGEDNSLILSLKCPPDILTRWVQVFPEHKDYIQKMGGGL